MKDKHYPQINLTISWLGSSLCTLNLVHSYSCVSLVAEMILPQDHSPANYWKSGQQTFQLHALLHSQTTFTSPQSLQENCQRLQSGSCHF